MPKNIIALDIGASKTLIGLVNGQNRIIYSHQVPTPNKKGSANFVRGIIQLIEPLKDSQTAAIALGVAGQVNSQKQTVTFSSNFPKNTRKVDLKKALTNRFKLPVYLDNDVHCFTLAESVLGSGQKYRHLVGLTLGTGIGGGIIIDKKPYRGYNNLVAEFGHMAIEICSPIRCSCGQYGHWEALVSGTGLENVYHHLTGKKKNTFAIEADAKAGGKQDIEATRLVAYYFALGLANIINTLNPEAIIVGGGFANFKMYWPWAIKELPKHLLMPSEQKTKIIRSQLGDQAILLGACLLARNNR
ncbi:MAG: ROK family protein [bacterium]